MYEIKLKCHFIHYNQSHCVKHTVDEDDSSKAFQGHTEFKILSDYKPGSYLSGPIVPLSLSIYSTLILDHYIACNITSEVQLFHPC